MTSKAHQTAADMSARIFSMAGVSSVTIRRPDAADLHTDAVTQQRASTLAWSAIALSMFDAAPDKVDTMRVIVGGRVIHCRRSGDFSVAVVAPLGHPIGKSIQRSMRTALRHLVKAAPPMTCTDCGAPTSNPLRPDPYADEINDDRTLRRQCDDCYQTSCDEL